MGSLIFVDCEGIDVVKGTLTQFGAVEFDSFEKGSPKTFYGDLRPNSGWIGHLKQTEQYIADATRIFHDFEMWLGQFKGRPIFVSDNPAYDWQGINYGFLKWVGHNPFGHSARRIGDYYAGLVNNWFASSEWKSLRVTKHTHMPVDDAMGNVEAYARMIKGERGKAHAGHSNADKYHVQEA